MAQQIHELFDRNEWKLLGETMYYDKKKKCYVWEVEAIPKARKVKLCTKH